MVTDRTETCFGMPEMLGAAAPRQHMGKANDSLEENKTACKYFLAMQKQILYCS